MQIKALLACLAVATALNVKLSATEFPGVPHGWIASPAVGVQYQAGYDSEMQAAFLSSQSASDQLGALTQTVDVQPYLNRHLTLYIEARNDGFEGKAEFFLQAKGGGSTHSTSANIEAKPGVWQKLHIAMGVETANGFKSPLKTLELGVVARGKGRIWFRNAALESQSLEAARKLYEQPIHSKLPDQEAGSALNNLEFKP
ncbi:hypothetical protein KSF73_16090 [Burkholderiaceae bacterium DAT-1]|nr:hypothetical protein [Burkholderiaceae bacterium DAT-1]